MPEFRVAFKGSRGLLSEVFLFSSLSTTGCLFSKPAPRAFRPLVQVQTVVAEEVYIEESGPGLDLEAPGIPAEAATLRMPEFPAPPKPPVRRMPQPVKAAPPPALATPPNITQLFTAGQRNDLTREFGQLLNLVVRDLETLSRKRLSADQNGQVERIKTLKKQAEDQFERRHAETHACFPAEAALQRPASDPVCLARSSTLSAIDGFSRT